MESNDSDGAGTAPEADGIGAQAAQVEAEAAAEASEAYALQSEVRAEMAQAALSFATLLARCKEMQLSIALMLNEADVESDMELLEELRVAMGAVAASLRVRVEAGRLRQEAAPPPPDESPAPPDEPSPAPPPRGGRGRR